MTNHTIKLRTKVIEHACQNVFIEASALIEDMQTKIDELEARVAALESEMADCYANLK